MSEKEIRDALLSMKAMAEGNKPFNMLASFPLSESKKPKSTLDLIYEGARKKGEDVHTSMNALLDYMLNVFDTKYFAEGEDSLEKAKENEPWWEVTCRWVNEVFDKRKKGYAYDFFGTTYEEYFKGKAKADMMGQFFTPMSIGKLMAEITYKEKERVVVNDCCCGSGRLPLAVYEARMNEIDNDEVFNFFFCGDLDHTSVKMCALNFMIHGVQGLVVHQDALTLEKPSYGYLINPMNYPVRSGVLSVQYLDSDACAEFVDWQEKVNGEYVVHSNLGKKIAYFEWMWNVVHDQETKTEQPKETFVITKDKEIEKRKEPIQLSLFENE